MSASVPVPPVVKYVDVEQPRTALLAGDMNFALDEGGWFVVDHAARSQPIKKDEA